MKFIKLTYHHDKASFWLNGDKICSIATEKDPVLTVIVLDNGLKYRVQENAAYIVDCLTDDLGCER